MAQYDYDLFTIGAGSGGVRASRMSASFGAKVAVAEERYLGGTCVNVGCIPKKLLVYAAHYGDDFSDAAGFGWTVGEPRLDWAKLIANKNKEITRLNGVYRKILDDSGVEILEGHARNLGSAHRDARREEDHREIYSRCRRRLADGAEISRLGARDHVERSLLPAVIAQESDHRRRRLHRCRVRRHLSRLGRAHDAALSRRIVLARL